MFFSNFFVEDNMKNPEMQHSNCFIYGILQKFNIILTIFLKVSKPKLAKIKIIPQ